MGSLKAGAFGVMLFGLISQSVPSVVFGVIVLVLVFVVEQRKENDSE